MGKKNPGTDQAHDCCNRLNHRKRPLRPVNTQRHATAHSQKDSVAGTKIRPRWWFGATVCLVTGQGRAWTKRLLSTNGLPPPRTPHFRRVRVTISSRSDAEVGCIMEMAVQASKWAHGR